MRIVELDQERARVSRAKLGRRLARIQPQGLRVEVALDDKRAGQA